MRALITRSKVYQSPGRSHPGFAWKYLYNVEGLPVTLQGFDRLDSALAAAASHGATFIAKQWGHAQTGAMHRFNQRQMSKATT
jgi:hypothetical protein